MKNRLTILLLCGTSLLCAQKAESDYTSSVDRIVQALYDVISGPAGERDWDKFRSLFYPDAFMGAVRTDSAGATSLKKMSPEEYIRLNRALFLKNTFYEKERHKRVMHYAHMAQVYSAYELEWHTAGGILSRRGLNSIQLLFENNRWWIMSLLWEEEKPGFPLAASGSGLTKIIVVRHAEKADDGTSNPPLSDIGVQRAEKLNALLADIKIDKLYSTPYQRTMQTLQPLSVSQKADLLTYDASDLTFAAQLLHAERGKTVVVSGHSNTVPGLVNAWLGADTYAQLPDDAYGNLWILTFQGQELLDCSLFHY